MDEETRRRFDTILEEVLDQLPQWVRDLIDEVPLHVEDYASDEMLDRMNIHHREQLCGLYTGIPLTNRSVQQSGALPDVVTIYREGVINAAANAHGLPGSCCHDSSYPAGGGTHGGLHPIELNTWFAMGGDALVGGTVSTLPTGIVDVLPTVLHLLGLEAPPGTQGRVLREALAAHAGEPRPVATEAIHAAESAAALGEGFGLNISVGIDVR